jgi:Caspase domain
VKVKVENKMLLTVRALIIALFCAVFPHASQAGIFREDLSSKNLVVFSTVAGKVALDGKSNDTNGPFTSALVPLITKADLPFGQFLSKLDNTLYEKSEGLQRIWVAGNWLGEFSLHSNSGFQSKRVALVIGNAQYKDRLLHSPEKDAKAISTALSTAGFEVTMLLNASRVQINDAIRVLSENVGSDGLALVYFSGFGFNISSVDYIAPVDFSTDDSRTRDFKDRIVEGALSVSFLVESLKKNRVSLLFIDVCRENPFSAR